MRTGSIDIAVLVSRPDRPPNAESPRLNLTTVQDVELLVAASATGAFAGRTTVHVGELVDAPWISTPSPASEPLLGVWPGLPGRAHIAHSTRGWLTKLHLVADGFGITTVPDRLSPVLPPRHRGCRGGVHAVNSRLSHHRQSVRINTYRPHWTLSW